MSRHTIMPARQQRTPYGEVSITSRWTRDHYLLRVYGSIAGVRWLFPKAPLIEIRGSGARHTFEPFPQKVTVERELRAICSQWQEHWNERLSEHQATGVTDVEKPHLTKLDELLRHRAELRKAKIDPATWEKEKHYSEHWRTELGPGIKLDAITETMLLQARSRLAARLKPGTVNCSFAVLRSCLTWAFRHGYMTHEPFREISKLKDPREQRPKPWWTPSEVVLALRCAEQDPHQPTAVLLVAIGCLLGLRYEEIIMLRWEDLDLDAKDPDGSPAPVCHVVPHGDWMPKDGEARTVSCHAKLHEILLKYRQWQGYVLTPESKKREKPMVRKADGIRVYRYDPRAVWKRIMARVVQAGGKAISPNCMRHTFASNHLNAGESEKIVAGYLGHANSRMIDQHYGHLLRYNTRINRVQYV